MMDDLAKELRCVRRNGAWGAAQPMAQYQHPLCVAAADRLEALEAQLAEARGEVGEIVAWLGRISQGAKMPKAIATAIEAGLHKEPNHD